MSSGGLDSHIYDVGETSRLIQQHATLDHIDMIGSYTTSTKRFMSPGELKSHIYDVGELYRLI